MSDILGPPDLVAEIRRLRVALKWCRQFVPYEKEQPLPGWIVRGARRADALLTGDEDASAFDAEWVDDAAPMSNNERDQAVPDGAQSAAPPSREEPS